MIKTIVVLFWGATAGFGGDWSPRLAAEYLDAREKAWLEWPTAKMPGGTCISCHTGATYLLARPILRKKLGEDQPTMYETALLDSLRARVTKKEAKDLFPALKTEPLSSQALGVESIWAALLLTLNDSGKDKLSPDAEQALERMWAFQIRDGKTKGAWAWFQLKVDPWEMPPSQYYGATLAALAAAYAPASYRNRPEIQDRIVDLKQYLQNEMETQPLHNRIMLLWDSRALGGGLTESQQKKLIDETLAKQETDGGWSIESLGPWAEHANAPESKGSNAYATAFTVFVLAKAGVPAANPAVQRATDWLKSHQNPKGYWDAISMNKQFKPGSMPELFMCDAATAFAAAALLELGN